MSAPRFDFPFLPLLLGSLALGVLSPEQLCAQTWDGGGGNNQWSTAQNWSANTVPASGAAVTFSGNVRLAPNLNSNRSVSSLTFASSASTFTLGASGGATLTIGSGGLSQASAATQTITAPIALSSSQAWDLSGGDLLVSGALSSSYVTLTKTGSGNLTLSGNNSGLQGPLVINAGTVTTAHSSALGSVSYGNTIASGATLALTGGITVTEGDLYIAGDGTSSGGAVRSVSGNNTLAADVKLAAASTIAADAGVLTLANTVALNGYSLTLAGPGAIVTSSSLNSGGAVVTSGSGARTFNASINAAFSVTGSGPVVVNQNINAGSGAVSLGGTGSVTLNGAQVNSGSLSVTGSTSVVSTATLNLGGGNLAVASSGSVAFNGPAINVGNVSVTGSGSTTLGTQISASGSFTQTGTGTTTFSGTGTNYFSSVNITGGEIILDQSSGYAFQVSGGSVNISGAEVLFASDNQIAGFNNVTLGDGAVLLLEDTMQNFANLVITGDSILDFGSGGSALGIGNLSLVGDATLTIINWDGTQDSFSATVDPGAGNLAQIIFADLGEAAWNPDGTITAQAPVPEPASFGLLSVGALALHYATRRRRSGR